VHPASHSWPMDKRDLLAMVGKMCTCFACCGSSLMSSSPVCVSCMVLLFGRSTRIPLCTLRMFFTGMVVCM